MHWQFPHKSGLCNSLEAELLYECSFVCGSATMVTLSGRVVITVWQGSKPDPAEPVSRRVSHHFALHLAKIPDNRSHIFIVHQDVGLPRSCIGGLFLCDSTCESCWKFEVALLSWPGLTQQQVVLVCIYRVTLHPYAKYPGPILAKFTSLYGAYYAYTGDMHLDIERCHKKYGKPSTLVTRLRSSLCR